MFGAGNAVAVLLFLPVGFAADRLGRKPLLVACWASSTIGAATFLPLQEWHGAFIGSALYWAGSAAVPVLSAQLAATTPRRALGRAFGLVFGAYFFGNIFASPFAGAIGAVTSLRAVIALGVVAFVLSTALVLLLRVSAPARSVAGARLPRPFWTLLAITPLASLVAIVSVPLFPVYLRETAGVPLERVGIYAGLVSLGAALSSAGNGRLADEFGPAPALVGGATVLTAGAAILTFGGRSEPLLLVGALLLGATQAANPVLGAVVERILPASRIALGYSVFQLAYAIGFGGGGTVAGLLYEQDPLLPFLVTIALALPVAAVVAVVVSRVGARAALGT